MAARIAIQSTPEIVARTRAGPDWLWDGYLARGMITLFTSRWKIGKTTLLSFLLSKLKAGGDLAEAAVAPGRAVVVSEEPASLWAARNGRHEFGDAVDWCCRPFVARPTVEEWEALVLELADRKPDLVVFDPLAMVLPRGVETNADAMLAALLPLRLLTDIGAAVLVLHHLRKSNAVGELSPRGTGALTGFADILVELDRPADALRSDRRRWLRSDSRLTESRATLIELSPDGRDYKVLAPEQEPESFDEGWLVLKGVLEDADERMTRNQILKSWPQDYDKPSRRSLVRWLDKALNEQKLERRGKGRTRDPFKYSLPGFVPVFDELPPLESLRDFMRR